MTHLVLLPGLDGTEIFFAPLLAALPPDVEPRVVCYPEKSSHGYAELLSIVRQAIADVPECYVLGWSFSGPLALMLAAAEPAKVRGVILSASFVRAPHPNLARVRFAVAGPVIWLWRAARRLPLWLLRPRTDALRQAKTQTWRRLSAGVIAARMREALRIDARRILQDCPHPVLYLASTKDEIVPHRCLSEIRRVKPSVRVVTIPGRHLAMYTHPQAAAQAITAFITRGMSYR
jgi:pimeloyl-ACP methyl ester carboxylesterase